MDLLRQREIFDACLELPPAERDEFLTRECPDAADRQRIHALLEAHVAAQSGAGAFLSEPPQGLEAKVGPYRLLEQIGRGGMGEVYVAEQTKPVRRRVALKILRPGMDTREVLARFDMERQTLALMEHPNVARILDAGATELGRPYVVMEYVPGVAITNYCDERSLSIEERLDLFLRVCAGVQHAHQRGIIHRDLKPSNILVTEIDGEPVPKIIDFGIAKATTPTLEGPELRTLLGHVIGTPDYMSPEQADRSPLDIDTRTDVYSLGVVLNELLTGRLPHASTQIDSSPLDIARAVADREPLAPSRQFEPGTGDVEDRARRRGAHCRQLAAHLRGDLDWIVLKALERDRRRRYRSALDLAADIERHRRHEPVSARPPQFSYLVGKFVRRHRLATTAAAVAVLSLLVFGVMMAIQAERIARERDRAEREAATARQVSQFLVDVFKVSDPDRSRGETVSARELLDQAAAQLDEGLAGQPVVRSRLETSIGEIYFNLGLYDRARDHFSRALAALPAEVAAADVGRLTAQRGLARSLSALGDRSEAERLIVDVLEKTTPAGGAGQALYVDALNDLGAIRYAQGRFQEARGLFQRAWEGRVRVYGESHALTATSLMNLATQHAILDDPEAAERGFLRVIDTLGRAEGMDHPQVLTAQVNLASLYSAIGEHQKSIALKEEVLPVMRRVLGEDHDHTLVLLGNLSASYQNVGRYDRAVELNREVVERLSRKLGPDHQRTLYWRHALAYVEGRLGGLDAAERELGAVLTRQLETLGAGHDDVTQTRISLADLLRRAERYEDAIALLEPTLPASMRAVGLAHPRTQTVILELAENHLALGRREVAVNRLRQARLGNNELPDLEDFPRVRALVESGGLDAAGSGAVDEST